jgi:Leucine rich repeat
MKENFSFLTKVLLLLVLLVLKCESRWSAVSCSNGFDLNVCVISRNASIHSPEYRFTTRDDLISVLLFRSNPNINFLPVDIAEAYPGLRHYNASSCSINFISKSNFWNLNSLEDLDLSRNFITNIHADTFDGLNSLETLILSEYSTASSAENHDFSLFQVKMESLS